MDRIRMVHVVSVYDQFHARLLAARLGSEGIVTELRPPLGGPYPLPGEVGIYVSEEDLASARELLEDGEFDPTDLRLDDLEEPELYRSDREEEGM